VSGRPKRAAWSARSCLYQATKRALALEEAIEENRHAFVAPAHDELLALPRLDGKDDAPAFRGGHARLGQDRLAGNRSGQMLDVDDDPDRGFARIEEGLEGTGARLLEVENEGGCGDHGHAGIAHGGGAVGRAGQDAIDSEMAERRCLHLKPGI
jgi:hypothetical protein